MKNEQWLDGSLLTLNPYTREKLSRFVAYLHDQCGTEGKMSLVSSRALFDIHDERTHYEECTARVHFKPVTSKISWQELTCARDFVTGNMFVHVTDMVVSLLPEQGLALDIVFTCPARKLGG